MLGHRTITAASATFALKLEEWLRLFLRVIFCSYQLARTENAEDSTYQRRSPCPNDRVHL